MQSKPFHLHKTYLSASCSETQELTLLSLKCEYKWNTYSGTCKSDEKLFLKLLILTFLHKGSLKETLKCTPMYLGEREKKVLNPTAHLKRCLREVGGDLTLILVFLAVHTDNSFSSCSSPGCFQVGQL